MRLDRLTDLMDGLSIQTWFNLSAARKLDMRMGEVTITEINLLAIARLLDSSGLNVELVATRKDEKTTGTDFEIWLTAKSGRAFGYAIQAKNVYLRDGVYEYPSLGHRNANGVQMDLLEAHAARWGAQPVHLFYNGWDLSDPQAPSTPPGPADDLYGCAAVMTPVVRRIRRRIGKGNGINRAAPYLAESMPWSDLFRIADSHGGPGPGAGPHSNDGSGPNDSSSPSSGPDVGGTPPPQRDPMRPIDFTDGDFLELEARSTRESESEARSAAGLPPYVSRARGVPRIELVDDDLNFDAPPFALLIEE